jgi:hypothetical protein
MISAFKKYAAAINRFIVGHSYYIIEWKDALPVNIHIVRQLNANTAIINLNSKEEFGIIKPIYFKIAEAIDTWKFSPSAERLIYTK